MIPEKRAEFNQNFKKKTYQEINSHFKSFKYPIDFRLSESPIFLTSELEQKLFDASQYIIKTVKETPIETLQKAVPTDLKVPGKISKPHFMAIDFGICKDENGELVPQLIEAQAFPSLYYFQKELERINQEKYGLAPNSNQPDSKEYYERLEKLILNGHPKENVILLEINPKKQKTAIDFALTEQNLDIDTVNISDVKKDGNKLYYQNRDGNTYPIHRIYNRIIWDELQAMPELKTDFQLTDDLDVEWATHPDWFFMMSKNLLPTLKHQYIPESYFVSEMPEDLDLSQFVLKPLYSFAGKGVDLNPTDEKIKSLSDPQNYILQKKVQYAPVFEDSNGDFSKAEIRLLYTWQEDEEEPKFMINLVRMTKADMVNVSFNRKDAIWIGSNIAYFG